MWFITIIPAVAAAIIFLVTGLSPELGRWKRLTVIALTILTIGAVIGNQWWEHYEKKLQDTRRTETLETLGGLIEGGESLMATILSHPDQPIPIDKINDWAKKSEEFLQTIGKSYVVRFKSDAGIMYVTYTKVDEAHNNWLLFIRPRLIRLHEFSAEFSGQIPKAPSANPF
jgi:hypothetical protein